MSTILHHTIFLPLPNGHGGEKRSYQLQTEVQGRGHVYQNIDYSYSRRLTLQRLWCALILLLRVHGIAHWRSLRAFAKYWRTTAYQYDQLIASFRDSKAEIFLWESVRPDRYILFYLACKYGKKVVACPHNIESLVPQSESALFRMTQQQAFEQEMRILRGCEQVYAISHEETWLLNLWGVNAQCYLYTPVGDILKQIDTIKSLREKTPRKTNYLLLGTAINEPTRMGMQHLIDFWAEYNIEYPLHVGGYGTDTLSIPANKPQIVFLGELTDEQLLQEQVQAKALLIYQPPTTGALTRICEAIAAGIPVIANYYAARSYHNISDVHTYQSDTDLLQILSNPV